MVRREVPFVGTFSLFYGWRNLSLLCEEFNIETVDELGLFFQEKYKSLGMKDIEKMVWVGLQRKDKPVTVEETKDLLEDYLEEKYIPDLLELVIRSQAAAIMDIGPQVEGEAKGETKTKKPPKQLKTSST